MYHSPTKSVAFPIFSRTSLLQTEPAKTMQLTMQSMDIKFENSACIQKSYANMIQKPFFTVPKGLPCFLDVTSRGESLDKCTSIEESNIQILSPKTVSGPLIVNPGPNDVLCGRGSFANNVRIVDLSFRHSELCSETKTTHGHFHGSLYT